MSSAPDPAARRTTRTRDGLLMVLAFASGASDAIAFVALGRVFTAVMTGNLVLVGVSLGSATLPELTRAAIAVGGYVGGVALAARAARRMRAEDEAPWPARVRAVLGGEAALQIAMLGWWLADDGRPPTGAVDGLLALSAVAMGTQSGAVQVLRAPDVSTTYLTGTLTTLVRRLSSGGAGGSAAVVARQAGVLVAMVGGAAAAAGLLDAARPLAPVLSPAAVLLVIAVASATGGPRRPAPLPVEA